jgi:hypothetical protein
MKAIILIKGVFKESELAKTCYGRLNNSKKVAREIGLHHIYVTLCRNNNDDFYTYYLVNRFVDVQYGKDTYTIIVCNLDFEKGFNVETYLKRVPYLLGVLKSCSEGFVRVGEDANLSIHKVMKNVNFDVVEYGEKTLINQTFQVRLESHSTLTLSILYKVIL